MNSSRCTRIWCPTVNGSRSSQIITPPMKDDAVPAIRVTCKGSLTVLIIDPQGFKYPRYVGLEYEE